MKKYIYILLAILVLSSLGYAKSNENITAGQQEELDISKGEARLTLLKSIVLPGWGQHSLGYNTRGYVFQSTELLGWLSYAAFSLYSQSREKDMKSYAAQYAGVNPSGKSDAYFDNVKHFSSIYRYNDDILRSYGDKRQIAQSLYTTGGDMDWNWESEEARDKYSKLHYDSRVARRNASLAATALIINRVISALDIMGLTGGNIEEKNEIKAKASFQPGYYEQTLSLQINL